MPDDPGEYHQAGAARSVDDFAGLLIAGRYRLLDRLGSGAMADVYRAHDETLDRDVAVKLFRAVMDEADTAGKSRRELELQALAQLSHPNLITLFDGSVSDADGPAFLALEVVEGPTLAAVLRSGALPEPQVRHIGTQIADALAYIHERGMVHRDVKPANILLGSDSLDDFSAVRARLSDFGIVRLVDDGAQVTAADLTVGTAYYLAPEQARSAAVGPEADVYALGLVLVEALTGARSFEGTVHEVLAARLHRDPHIPAHLPEPWPALLRTMTASDPARRPSAAHVARTLRSTAASGAVPIAGAAGLASLGGKTAAAGATAAAATSALPRAGVKPTFPPAASFSGADQRSPKSEPESEPRRHKLTGLTIAAAAFLAVLVGTGWFLARPSGHPTPQHGHVVTPLGTSSAAATSGHPRHASNSRHRHAARPAPNQAVDRTFSDTRTARPPARRSSNPAPTTSASTTSVPPTTAPPTDPRTSSGPPSTSDAPSTTAPPTSAEPSTTAAPSSGLRTTSPPPSGNLDVAQQQLVSGPG